MKKYLEQNISILPIADGVKTPPKKFGWQKYQKERIPLDKYDEIFDGINSVAMIGGAVSGNLECLDFDNKLDNAKEVLSNFYSIEAVIDVIEKYNLPMQDTPSGGFHIIYKCDEAIGGSQKLARQLNPTTDKPEVLIETRGEGGYFLVYPSVGYKPFQGELGQIPTVSKAERDLLISAAKSLNVYYEKTKKQIPNSHNKGTEINSGDDYNRSTGAISDTIRLLRNHGWSSGNEIHWIRPNKKKGLGISATLGIVDAGMFYVFSSNAHPFEDKQGYYPFAVKALLEFGGDYGKCAKELGTKGFGFNPTKAKTNIEKSVNEARGKGYNLSPSEIEDLSIDNKISIEAVKEQIYKNKTEISVIEKPKGKGKITLIEVENYIGSKFDIRINVVLNLIEFKTKKEKEFRDMNVFDIMRQASVDGLEITETNVNTIIGSTAIREEYDPFLETFENLPEWDKKDHIKELCEYFTLVDESKREFFTSMMKKAMLRTIKCGLEADYYNRMVLSLISPKQELGKSYFIRWINPTPDRYYNSSPLSDKTDSLISYTNCLIYNIDELDNAGKTALSTIKGLISIQSVNVRLPYAKQAVWMPRRCTFWGTGNEKDFLEEKTNSRWICFDIENINKDYSIKIDKDQMWAQLYSEYKSVAEVELTDEEKNIRDITNTVYVEETIEQSMCKKLFIKSESEWMSNANIYDTISEFSSIKNPNSRKIGKALKILGFEQKTVNNTRGWLVDKNKSVVGF